MESTLETLEMPAAAAGPRTPSDTVMQDANGGAPVERSSIPDLLMKKADEEFDFGVSWSAAHAIMVNP